KRTVDQLVCDEIGDVDEFLAGFDIRDQRQFGAGENDMLRRQPFHEGLEAWPQRGIAASEPFHVEYEIVQLRGVDRRLDRDDVPQRLLGRPWSKARDRSRPQKGNAVDAVACNPGGERGLEGYEFSGKAKRDDSWREQVEGIARDCISIRLYRYR